MNFLPQAPQLFAPFVGQEFHAARADASAAALTLESLRTFVDDEAQLSFSLLFTGSDPRLPDGIYEVSHPQLGTCTLTLNLVMAGRGALRHQAVVNLLRPFDSTPFPASTPENSNP